MVQELIITNAYVNLASGIILQAKKDIERYESQIQARKVEMQKPTNKRDYAKFLSAAIYQDSVEFMQSEYAEYLIHMVIDWKLLNDHGETENV